MPKENENFDRILEGLVEAVCIENGDSAPARVFVPTTVDVVSIRKRMGMTQNEFAATFGLSVSSLRDWEQGRSRPEPTARVLLTVIEREPDAVKQALRCA